MPDQPLNLTPSDIAGALHRSLVELTSYVIQTHALGIDVAAIRTHLDHTAALVDSLETMQAAIAQHQAASGAETRTN